MALKYEDESYRIRGAVFEVCHEKGGGFYEAVHQECLEMEPLNTALFSVVHNRSYGQRSIL
jgi:Zn-dependent M32 family carboxypeptidase